MRFEDVKVGQQFRLRGVRYVRVHNICEKSSNDVFNVVHLNGDFAGHIDWIALTDEVEVGYEV